jgi:hypothetical protein
MYVRAIGAVIRVTRLMGRFTNLLDGRDARMRWIEAMASAMNTAWRRGSQSAGQCGRPSGLFGRTALEIARR